jgi:hypothetical protein
VGERGKTALAPFLGAWVVVELTVLYGTAGSIDMTIRRISDGQVLLSYAGAADTWQASDTGHDPKFGLYRSLNSPTFLRDEQVRFADFCVSKLSAADCAEGPAPPAPDAGPPPRLDAAPPPPDTRPPPDTAPLLPPDAPVTPPPKLDAAVVVPPPKLDAAVVVPPQPDAAVVAPPKLDAAVVVPPPDAAAPAPAADAAPPARDTAPRPDAARPLSADAAADELEPDAAPADPFRPMVPGSARTRRPGGGGTGCALVSGGESGSALALGLLAWALVVVLRRRSS